MAWTGYEYATLAVTAFTPITVAGLGFFVAHTGRRLERVQWANQAGDMDEIQAAYIMLGERFRDDLYVTHQRMLLNAPS